MFPRPSRPRFLRRPLPALLVLVAALMPALAFAQAPATAPTPHAPPAWVARSNENAQVLLRILARFAPEQAASFGVSGLDGETFDLTPGYDTRAEKATSLAIDTLKARLATEKDPAVKQDLSILISSAEGNNEGSRLGRKFQLPYLNVSQVVFQGLRALLDDQVPAERRAFALKRLNRYAGLEPGTQPLTTLAMARTREKLADTSLIGPFKGQVERDLAQSSTFVAGIEEMFKKYNVTGYEKGLAALKDQFTAYDAFVRSDILPRARVDFRQPAEIYAFNLRQVGVDMPVAELTSRATVSFKEIQNQMQALAPRVAKEKGIAATDYRDVIAALKKQQLVGDAILPHYRQRVKDIETIIKRENIVTLPDREMRIELSSAADAAQQPAPHMQPPPLIGNTGQMGTFVLPLHVPSTDGKTLDTDDFTFEAASWTLTAHEGRPGHELQFAGMVENGVSIARALFAFNSVNVEGWGLYAEAEMQPYEPLEGQLIALQHRLMRSARAFLDPGLQAGTITKEEATRVLRHEVCLSEAMTLQEVQRYTFRAPGQATSYFVGYNRILEIRAEAERMLGDRFDRKKFNDFVISQGLIPPPLLRKAVMEEFVPSLKSAS